jgi:hypothetical protein
VWGAKRRACAAAAAVAATAQTHTTKPPDCCANTKTNTTTNQPHTTQPQPNTHTCTPTSFIGNPNVIWRFFVYLGQFEDRAFRYTCDLDYDLFGSPAF